MGEITKTTLDQAQKHFDNVIDLINNAQLEMIDMNSEIHLNLREELSLAHEYTDQFTKAKHQLIVAQQEINDLANKAISAVNDLNNLLTDDSKDLVFIDIQYQTMIRLLGDVKTAVSAAKEKHNMALETMKDLALKLPEQHLKFCFRIQKPCFEENTDFFGNNIKALNGVRAYDENVESPQDCQKHCREQDECEFWSLAGRNCWMKKSDLGRGTKANVISGPKFCKEDDAKFETSEQLIPICQKVQTSVEKMDETLQSALNVLDDELKEIESWQTESIQFDKILMLPIEEEVTFKENLYTDSFTSKVEDLGKSAQKYQKNVKRFF